MNWTLSCNVLDIAKQQTYPPGALYVVATPIGNTADISLRALYLLQLCDRIAAEDTRRTKSLLKCYGISKPLISVYKHNECSAIERLAAYLYEKQRIAFVCDAGTPGISDPGARLVEGIRMLKLPVIPLPGPSAFLTTLSVTGSWASTFTFIGFLPNKCKQRIAVLKKYTKSQDALVFYEAPHRLRATLDALLTVFEKNRKVFIARELTKLHETFFLGTLIEAYDYLKEKTPRGEYVLAMEGTNLKKNYQQIEHDTLLKMFLQETTVSISARLVSKLTGISKDFLYSRALEIQHCMEIENI